MTLELMARLKAWLSADPNRHEFCLSRNEVQQIVEAIEASNEMPKWDTCSDLRGHNWQVISPPFTPHIERCTRCGRIANQ